jgi:hypothetical protein
VAGLIVTNFGVLVAGWVVDGREHTFETAHSAILMVFVAEMAVWPRAAGRWFFADGWNCFDAGVIAACCLPMLGVDAGLLRVARLTRLAHLLRHLSGLRLLRLVPAVDSAAARVSHRSS